MAALAGLSSGAATTVIDRLEKSGFVRREPIPQDRRKTIL
ncbi:MarR family transcriptional regulator [Paenibacillus cisolokensis]